MNISESNNYTRWWGVCAGGVRELYPNFRFIAKMGLSYRSNATEVPDDVRQLLLPDVSDLDLPEPLLTVGLRGFRCLDEVPLGLLLVLLQ